MSEPYPSFRAVPRTGVIFVMAEAGALPGGPARKTAISINPADQEYAPVGGLLELREAVAALYNARHRKGMKSRYTEENVSIAGGGSRPLQRAAAELVNEKNAAAEASSLQSAFRAKRDLMRAKLTEMGVILDGPRDGTFYCWGSVEKLPRSLNTGMGFFKKALIVVPGDFFDVNPGKRRAGRSSRFRSHVRFSFGPSGKIVREGLDRLRGLI